MGRRIRFGVGAAIRRLRTAGSMTIEDAADSAETKSGGRWSTSRWQRLETKSTNLDRWLTDLDDAAQALGLTLEDLVARARKPAA